MYFTPPREKNQAIDGNTAYFQTYTQKLLISNHKKESLWIYEKSP